MNLFLPFGVVFAAGLVAISSISTHLVLLQSLWAIFGFIIIGIFIIVDWRVVLNYRWFIWGLYGFSIVLLGIALTAPMIRNTKSWIVIGSATFQPVEMVKVALILVYAQYFSRRHVAVARWQNIFASFTLFALPAVLVMLQPDLGSTVVLFGVWFGFLLVSGLPRRRIILALGLFIILGFIGWHYALEPYQRERIIGVFYPEKNALTVNYSVIQSKIAIGSAGLWGKGYSQGSQTQLGFLSEPENDFILPALIEEWGLVVGIMVIVAFIALVINTLRVGMRAPHNFEKFICLGTAIVWGVHFVLNTGSSTGILPVIGIPFPFLSYGGSNLLMNSLLLGIINAIRRNA